MPGLPNAIRWKRLWRRNWHRLSFMAGLMRGYGYVFSNQLKDLVESQALPGETQPPVVIASFHVSGMYGLLGISRYTRPIVCLVTNEAKVILNLLRLRPDNVRFVSDLSAADIRSIRDGAEYLLLFADVNTSKSKMVHVPVYGKARVFSASWVSLAQSLNARTVAVSCLRDRQTLRLDGIELDLQAPPSSIVAAAFDFMQSQVPDPDDWDMIVSHPSYSDCQPICPQAVEQWRMLAASDLETSRLIAAVHTRLVSTETQDAVHSAEPETV